MIESSKFEEIKDLVRDSKLEIALEEVQKLINEFEEVELSNELITIQSRFKTLKKKIRLGTINSEEENVETYRIVKSTLDFISQLESEKLRLNYKKENKQLPSLSESELLEAAKAAVILVDLEKIKHKYFYSELHLREDILDELRVYKPVSTDITTIEIYNFLFEVADSVNYRSSDNFGVAIFSLVMYFFPEETGEVDTILGLSINIGSQLVLASIFNLEDFKIGVYGLSIWKWVYLRATWRGKTETMERVKSEYVHMKNFFYEDNVKISNYEGKIQLIEIFEKDLEKAGLTFPRIPNEILKLI